jgi:glycerophosphoryl diester phosphodiesterase
MKIISHRGYWKNESEKNQITAFNRSFELGFGTETDLRDSGGEIVISHDMPTGGELKLIDLLYEYKRHSKKNNMLLALNIKADGMATEISNILNQSIFQGIECFFFDMAIPDMMQYIKKGMPVYMRMSELEKDDSLLRFCNGIWLDSFEAEWYTNDDLKELLKKNTVCIVSSELHKRDNSVLWTRLKELKDEENLTLCTDFPEEFDRFSRM